MINKSKVSKIFGFLGSVVASGFLAFNGQTAEAAGILAAAFSSATIFAKGE